MKPFLAGVRALLPGLLCASLAAGVLAPVPALAELSNDTLLGPGLR